MNKLVKQTLSALFISSIIGSQVYINRDNLFEKSNSVFYHYDSERYRFFDKHTGELARVRQVEYPNLDYPFNNLFECFYVKYDETGEIVKSGDFLTANKRIVHLTENMYSVERIVDN